MNKTIRIITFIAIMTSLFSFCSALAQVKTDYSDNPHRISIGYGYGYGNILPGNWGYCGSLELTLPFKNNCFLFGFNNVIGLHDNPPFSGYFFGGDGKSYEIRSYYACYGRPWRVKSIQMGVYGGLEAMSGYDSGLHHFNVVGLHADYAAIKKIGKNIGFGADVFANYSLDYSDIGLRVFVCLTD